MPASHYESTKCNWASEDARPSFVGFDSVPEQCVNAPTGTMPPEADDKAVSHMLLGAAAGAAVCMLLGLALMWAVHSVCGLRFSFVRLVEERVGEGAGAGSGGGGQMTSPPASPPGPAEPKTGPPLSGAGAGGAGARGGVDVRSGYEPPAMV